MEKFTFDYYKDSAKKIKCFYTFNGEVSEDTRWQGYIFTQNLDGVLNIEGYERDEMDSFENNGNPHFRYILGNRAISYSGESLSFEIYPAKIAPIHYDMYYNSNDGCFYGYWSLMPSTNHPRPRYGNGEAIIYIEDSNTDETKIKNAIQRIADRSKEEYFDEIEAYLYITKSQILETSEFKRDNSVVVKKLSRFAKTIKK